MKTIPLRRLAIFLLQSVTAGLAIAFLILVLFPRLQPVQSGGSFDLRNQHPGFPGEGGLASYADAVAVSAPAVVNVYSSRTIQADPNPILQDPVFIEFFGMQGSSRQSDIRLGSGVVMRADGYLITNSHIVRSADEIRVTLADGRQTSARVIGLDPETDLAVLRIDLERLPVIRSGDSDRLAVGDVVLAIGNPFDLGQTVTQGIVSAIGRKRLGVTTFENFIQTDADINIGNSGGALVDIGGRLVGINTALLNPGGGGSQGIGFAIPANVAIAVMESLIEYGYVIRGWLGIEAQVAPADPANTTGERQPGVLVAGILNGGPAEAAGIMPGDLITSVDGKPVYSPHQLIEMISFLRPGTRIEVAILRGWERLALTAQVTQRPSRP